MITLSEHEFILTVYAERCDGPGWANRLYWIVIEDRATGKVRKVAIQPEEMNRELADLFPWVSLAHSEVMGAVRRWIGRSKA